jgi:hypothetical protein
MDDRSLWSRLRNKNALPSRDRRERSKSSDTMMTHRLSTILALAATGLVIPPRDSAVAQELSARDFAIRYCELESRGETLSPDGWQRMAALFVAPGAPWHDRVMVVRDFGVSRPLPEQGRIGFVVSYRPFGEIDPSEARFSPLPQSLYVKGGFFVVKQSTGWRIEGPMPQPHLTVDTAIRYATELRANAKEVAIRKNADRMISMLKRLR